MPLETLLTDEYRKNLWAKAQEVLAKLKQVLPISKITVLGSFCTSKSRPADVDFMVLVRTESEGEWAVDFVLAPDNSHGNEIVKDAVSWMREKYGEGAFEIIELERAFPCVTG